MGQSGLLPRPKFFSLPSRSRRCAPARGRDGIRVFAVNSYKEESF